MKKLILLPAFVAALCCVAIAQVPVATGVQILKAEDARRYDSVIENLLRSPSLAVRERAALAAGRIGDERAIEPLAEMFGDKRNAGRVWTMAVFAIGEIESVKGADHIITVIKSESGYVKRDAALLSRAFEAAGKIAAANSKDPAAKELGDVILKGLEFERNSAAPSAEVIRKAVTAVMRARPVDGDKAIIPFLAHTDPDVVADTLNALARSRSKNANRDARDLLETNLHAMVRANAARVLGAAEDKGARDLLLKAAMSDSDPRVRVSAIRSLGSLKDGAAAAKLTAYAETLADRWKASKTGNAAEKNELLELATVISRLLSGTKDSRADKLLRTCIDLDRDYSPEFLQGWVRITPTRVHDFTEVVKAKGIVRISKLRPFYQVMVEAASTTDAAGAMIKAEMIGKLESELPQDLENGLVDILADALRAYTKLKPEGAGPFLIKALESKDVFVRAAAAELMADLPATLENVDSLNSAFDKALEDDVVSNDAILAIMDALYKLDKKGSRGSVSAFILASASHDQLVRLKARSILKDDAYKNKPELQTWLSSAEAKNAGRVRPWSGKGSKIGQVLAADADYTRALSRRNGSVKAVLVTEKGTFTIVFNSEDAPLTVDNWVKLARSGYFNGLEVHRVVPNFVVQDGDPHGDGNGGPGWSIRCEINLLPYDRGAVGMALSGKDTGGSQWFVTHSPQPHLDGGYTVFGHVDEAGMKVVDKIVRGDKVLKVTIVETRVPPRAATSKAKAGR